MSRRVAKAILYPLAALLTCASVARAQRAPEPFAAAALMAGPRMGQHILRASSGSDATHRVMAAGLGFDAMVGPGAESPWARASGTSHGPRATTTASPT